MDIRPAAHLTQADIAASIAAHPKNDAERYLHLLALARREGASVRTLAKIIGVSKSTMGRWLPTIDAIASHLGQRDSHFLNNSETDLSQMGQHTGPDGEGS